MYGSACGSAILHLLALPPRRTMLVTVDVFDSLQFVRRLKEMGVPDAQAEAGAELARETIMRMANNLATRDDLEALRRGLEDRFDVRCRSLEDKIDAQRASLEDKMDAQRASLEDKIDAQRASLEDKIYAQRASLEDKMDLQRVSLEDKIDAQRISLEDKIVALGESQDLKADRRRAEMECNMELGFADLRTRIAAMHAELKGDVRVTRVMVWFLGLIVLGTWGVLALPIMTSIRVA